MDPFDYFFVEEFIFPEEGGVTGECRVPCPYCDSEFDLAADSGITDDRYECSVCGEEFSVNWVDGTVSMVEE